MTFLFVFSDLSLKKKVFQVIKIKGIAYEADVELQLTFSTTFHIFSFHGFCETTLNLLGHVCHFEISGKILVYENKETVLYIYSRRHTWAHLTWTILDCEFTQAKPLHLFYFGSL